MGFRILCFLAIVVVPGTAARIALLLAAAVLPALAVMIANAVDRRSHAAAMVEPGAPESRRALPKESSPVVSGEVID